MITVNKAGVTFNVIETTPELNNFWIGAFPSWENNTYEQIIPHLSKDKVFIDIGSWAGPISLVAQAYSKKCICIEADPVAYGNLLSNVGLNNFNNIKMIHSAMVPEGVTTLSVGQKSGLGGGVSSYLNTENSVKCKVITLQKLLTKYKLYSDDISVIKIDIEGYECELLKDPIFKKLNVPMHISLHAAFFANQEKYFQDLEEFFGKGYSFQRDREFYEIFIDKKNI